MIMMIVLQLMVKLDDYGGGALLLCCHSSI
jgi:hypothetical protein